MCDSLVPRPLPDFISQPWRKIGQCDKIWEGSGDEAICVTHHEPNVSEEFYYYVPLCNYPSHGNSKKTVYV